MGNKKNILVFVPVLHEGYRRFFEKYASEGVLYIFGRELIAEFPHLLKEIRLLDSELIKKAIESWGLFERIVILDKSILEQLQKDSSELVMPDEDVMHELKEKYFQDREVEFDSVFLRWDKHNTVAKNPVIPDQKISNEEFDQAMIHLAKIEAEKSSDWWRQIGAVIVKDGGVVVSAHNTHVPSEHMPYQNGDPRNNFHKGVYLELSTSIHAEAMAIAEAARQGSALEGASLYVSTFPCPPCAKLIAYSGIKKLFYRSGYGMLDGESILRDQGVEIIFVSDSVIS